MSAEHPAGTTTYRGVEWRRDRQGVMEFHDRDSQEWVRYRPGGDAPPVPPGWAIFGVGTSVARPGRWTRWRVFPAVLVVVAVILAVVQVLRPSSSNASKEAKASAALLGKCLSRDGSLDGHPRFSSTTVACDSPQAAVKVVAVLTTTPGSPLCPAGTTGTELAYAGVQYPHVECLQPVTGGR